MKTLLLWDIDGTLINAHRAGSAALRDALVQAFGISDDLSRVEFSGRTDRWICRQMMELFGLPQTEESFGLLRRHYLQALPLRLSERGVSVLPGVAALLAEAGSHQAVTQGLLTGNLREGARTKLSAAGLWDHFSFGAFADDAENRNELGPVALERACAHAGDTFSPSRTWVIGDTPHDIRCGQAAGLRTLGLATGRHSLEELAPCEPDALLPDLSDARAFWNIVQR